MKRLILLIFCLFSIVSWGQSIKGKVIDAQTKETIPGANIAVPGVKGVGTSTDFDGNFTFTLPAGKTQIQVSFVGYKTQVVNVNPGATVTVSLAPDAAMLEDVVVIGYGTQKKESLSAAVTSVDVAKAVESRPVPDLARALQGTTPGLTITVQNGELGEDPKLRIRGQYTSINAESNPLILLDNVEIPSMSFVNPDDVESISVLKDAASSAIYGAKAANGVVLIKSKNGSRAEGTVSVNYSGSFTFRQPTTLPEIATYNGYEYVMNYGLSRQSPSTVGNPVSGGVYWLMNSEVFDRAKYWHENWSGKLASDAPMVYGRDWETISIRGGQMNNYGYRYYDAYGSLYKDWSPQNQHNISIGGTAGKTSYNIGLGYLNQVGFLKNTVDNYERYNASVSVTTEVNKFMSVRASMMYTKAEKAYPNNQDGVQNDALWYAMRWSSYFPIGTTYNGGYINSSDNDIKQSNIMTRTQEYLRVNVGTTLRLLKGWTADFDMTYANDMNFRYYPGTWMSYYNTWNVATIPVLDQNGNQIWRDRDGNIVPANTEGASAEYGWNYDEVTTKGTGTDYVREQSAHSDRVEINAFTTYRGTWGDHSFSAMVGLNSSSYRYYMNNSKKFGLADPSRPYFGLASGNMEASGSRTWQSQAGYFGRIDYSWKDKLFVQFNGRYDGTSKYPTDMRWKFFPSGSIAYAISQEDFFAPLKDVVSFLKVRASYGSLGNQAVPANMYIPTLTKGTNSYWGQYGAAVPYERYSSPSLIRSDVTWETITTLDFGLDARFWKNKVGLTFDWYNRKTTDMFVPGGTMPNTYGGDAPKGNFGSMRTNGWELALDFNHKFNNGLTFAATFGLSDSKAKLLEYTESTTHTFNGTVNGSNYYTGMTMGEIWGYKYDRLYQMNDFEEVTALNGNTLPSNVSAVSYYGKYYKIKPGYTYSTLATPRPGGVKYKDLDGDGAITGGTGTVEDPGDRTVIGNLLPRYEYHFRFDLSWKGFDLSLFFQGVGQRDAWSRGPLVSPAPELGQGAVSSLIDNIWSESNPNAYWPRLNTMSREDYTSADWQQNDHYLLDMSYLRLKQLTFGYTVPKRLTQKISINRLRVYFTAENLFTIDNLKVPIDPELQTGNASYGANYAGGQLGVTTPLPKYYSLGLQLGL